MELVKFNGESQTMSSREIAELTAKRHDHVLRDVRVMLGQLYGVGSVTKFEDTHTNEQNGQTYPVFNLPYDETMCLLTGYDAKSRMKVIQRWQELEQANAFKVPQTMSEALRLAADQQDKIEAQQLQIEAQKPAVAFVERFVEARSSKCLSDVAKILGKKPHAFIQQLKDDGVIFRRGGCLVPSQGHMDAGRFTVKAGEASGHAYEQTRVEPKGIEWLARVYG